MALVYLMALPVMWFLFCEASISVPASLLSPLGVPDHLSPAGITAMKHAVGGRMLTMLGTVSRNSMGDYMAGPLPGMADLSPELGTGMERMLPGYPPLTPRSKEFSKRRGPNIPTSFNIRTATPTEVENFFAVLDKVDSNKCISRLVCEVGSNPKVLEGLGHNIRDVMTSLRVLEKNALSRKYREIMMYGQKRGMNACRKSYSECDQKNYRLVRTFIKAFRVQN